MKLLWRHNHLDRSDCYFCYILGFLINLAVLCNLSEICSDSSICTLWSLHAFCNFPFLCNLKCLLLKQMIGVGQWYFCPFCLDQIDMSVVGHYLIFLAWYVWHVLKSVLGVYSCLNLLPMDIFQVCCSCVDMSAVITLLFCKLLCLGGILGFCPLLFWLSNCLLLNSYGIVLFLNVLT